MDPAVVIPLLTEKIAASKRKKGAAALVGGLTLTWWRRKAFLEKKVAAQNTQHRIRTIRARREYQKWSKERQARLKREAEENARKFAEEKVGTRYEPRP